MHWRALWSGPEFSALAQERRRNVEHWRVKGRRQFVKKRQRHRNRCRARWMSLGERARELAVIGPAQGTHTHKQSETDHDNLLLYAIIIFFTAIDSARAEACQRGQRGSQASPSWPRQVRRANKLQTHSGGRSCVASFVQTVRSESVQFREPFGTRRSNTLAGLIHLRLHHLGAATAPYRLPRSRTSATKAALMQRPQCARPA